MFWTIVPAAEPRAHHRRLNRTCTVAPAGMPGSDAPASSSGNTVEAGGTALSAMDDDRAVDVEHGRAGLIGDTRRQDVECVRPR